MSRIPRPSAVPRRPARTLGGLVTLVLATIAGLTISATAAFAHHAEIPTASVACTGLVSFTSSAWSGSDVNGRTNPAIQVSYSTNGGSNFTVLPQKSSYRYGSDNSFTFSDTFQLPNPLASSVIVRVQATASWANGAGPGSSRQTGVLSRSTCPAEPHASIADVDCAKSGASVTLANGGEDSVTFTLSKDGQVIDTVPVAGGATTNKTYSLGEDEDATVKVTAPAMSDLVRSLTRNCEQPAAAASVSCAADGAYVTFSNDGDSPTTFTVYKGEAQVDSFSVDGHDEALRTYEMGEDETATFSLTSTGGMEEIVTELSYDCQRPRASLSSVGCSEGAVTATLVNDGESTTTFTVHKNGEVIDTVEVEGGATDRRTYALAEDETATFAARSTGGMEAVEATIAHDCEEPITPPVTPPVAPVPPVVVPRALGATFTSAALDEDTLPVTGSEPLSVAIAGFGLLLLGSLIARRYRTNTV